MYRRTLVIQIRDVLLQFCVNVFWEEGEWRVLGTSRVLRGGIVKGSMVEVAIEEAWFCSKQFSGSCLLR